MGSKRRLVYISRLHPDLVVAGTEVQLSEELRTMRLIEEFVDDGDGECILDGEGVKGAVVHAKPPSPILFLDQQYRRRERRVATADDALVEHGGALPLLLVLMRRWVAVGPNCHRCRAGLEDDGVIPCSLRWQPRWFGEHPCEGVQQLLEEGVRCRGGCEQRWPTVSDVRPGDLPALVLKGDGAVDEVPHHPANGDHPVSPQDEVIAGERHDEEVDEERLALDDDRARRITLGLVTRSPLAIVAVRRGRGWTGKLVRFGRRPRR